MPTLYKSILLTQPNDGEVVYVRRFTRDPPILAAYLAPLRLFISNGTFTITVTGSTLDGQYAATWQANLLGSGKPGWLATSGTNSLYFLPQPWGLTSFGAKDNTGHGFFSRDTPYIAGMPTAGTIIDIAPNPFGQPTVMSFGPAALSQLLLPASLVSAWRPE